MEFRRGVSLRHENDFNIQANWIPVTPEKPASTTILGGTWHESIGLGPQFLQENSNSNEASAGLNLTSSMDQNKVRDYWETVLAGKKRVNDHIVGPYVPAVKNVSAGWNNNPYEDPFALAQAATAPGASAPSSNVAQRGSNYAVARPFFPISYSHIESGQQPSNCSRMSLVDQNHSISSNLSNQSHPSQIPFYGFPVPYHRNYDLNSPHRTIADAVSNGNISFQFAPVTPDKGKEGQNKQPSSVANGFLDERSNKEKNVPQDGMDHKGKNPIELHYKESHLQLENLSSAPLESVLQQLYSSSAALSIPLEGNQNPEKGEENDIDLNKTPEQKPKRRKHRPRVVIEGKPKRTPKPTVKQSRTNENTPKRKYVRKNGIKASTTPSAVIVESTDPMHCTYVKSCKRSLNFNLEGQARDGDHGTTLNHQEVLLHSCVNSSTCRLACNFNSDSQAKDLCTGTNGMSGTKSTLQLSQGMEVIVERSPARIPFDLNCSLTQRLDDYISLPEKPAPTTPELTRTIQPKENLNRFTKNVNDKGMADVRQQSGEKYHPQAHEHINAEGTGHAILPTENGYNNKIAVPAKLQSNNHSISKSLNNLNCNHNVVFVEDEEARGSKRGHCHNTDVTHLQSMNLIAAHFNSLPVNQEIFRGNEYHGNSGNLGQHLPEIYKKRKMEEPQNKVISSTSASVETMGIDARQALAYSENHTNPNLFTSQSNDRGSGPQFHNANCTKKITNVTSNSMHELYFQSKAAGNHCQVQSLPVEFLSRMEALSGASLDKQQASEFMRTTGKKEIKMEKRSRGPTRVRDLASLTATAQCTFPSTPPKTALRSGDRQGIETLQEPKECMETLDVENHAKKATKKKRSNKGLALVNTASYNSANEVKQYDHHQPLTKSRGPLEVAQPYNVGIDEIIQRLNSLNISGGFSMNFAQEQKALVPFGGHAQMIPYEGLFDPIKKRRPRPKVDLDPETDRVWKLLMGKESNEGVEGTDADKEKWWEEERRVFRGRADSFIARMHLIQGDRRFSQWNGSVVDSVIGVFLTQNVSDHLSSSAFMSLAARFPLKSTNNDRTSYKNETDMYVEEPEVCILDSDDNNKWQKKNSREPVCDQVPATFQEAEHVKEREMGNSNESYGRNIGGGSPVDISKSNTAELPQNITDTTTTRAGFELSVEADMMAQEDLVSSQSSDVSVDSSTLQTAERTITRMGSVKSVDPKNRSLLEDVVSFLDSVDTSSPQTPERTRSCSDSNSETEDPMLENKYNSFNCSTSFMELLQMAGTTMLQENYSNGRGGSGLPFTQRPIVPSSNYSLQITPNSGVLEVECPEVLEEGNRFSSPLTTCEITQINNDCMTKTIGPLAENVIEPSAQQKVSSSAQIAYAANPCSLLRKQSVQPSISLGHEACSAKQLYSCNNLREVNKTVQHESTPVVEPKTHADALDQRRNSSIQQAYSNLPNFSGENLDAVESMYLIDKHKSIENKVVESNSKAQVYFSENASTGVATNTLKEKGKLKKEKKAFDWDSLRKDVFRKGTKKERSKDAMDSLDWEAVRCADVNEIAETIKERGMNNMLAERIKAFLNRCVREHGNIDLEWLRDVPPDKAKEYLLSVRGLGLKSVECVRLLTLHHLAFPVDTNVGRIAVRLGWVPLQPLPESLQLHLLELYPMLESIQKYLWPRLCTLDQRTLYELHYQMITFGKVFCTKSKPNCNACPMRAECKHFASAFASARLALPGPEEKGIVSSTAPITTNQNPDVAINPVSFLQLEANMLLETKSKINKCEPIIEEPATPEPECAEIPESDIEDEFYEDPNEIPTIKLNIKEFALNLQSYMQENNMELQEGDMSKALVALNPKVASIPMPKLKNVSRLRTEHQVYELPDSHPLLEGVAKRVPGDICSYLLAIWTPGETAESIQPPERCCGSQMAGNLCKETTCFSCNSIREANSQKVRGTLLIPCKTAMRGSFPLNGTYFQVNEVFADHDSSLNPIDVPRTWIWNLPRRTVFFGTSIPTIFKGQSTEEIQSCFWKGYVCVRGFDQKTRAPRPLMARLHFPVSKLTKTKTKTGDE